MSHSDFPRKLNLFLLFLTRQHARITYLYEIYKFRLVNETFPQRYEEPLSLFSEINYIFPPGHVQLNQISKSFFPVSSDLLGTFFLYQLTVLISNSIML